MTQSSSAAVVEQALGLAPADASARAGTLLAAVARVSQGFLTAGAQEQTINEALEELGRAAGVSRAYIFQNKTSDDGLVMDPLYEWGDDGIARKLGRPGFHDLHLFERWRKALAAGDSVQQLVRELPPADRAFFVADDVQSILLVPLFVSGEWWGEITFDDVTVDRAWSTVEVEALRAAAGILAASIARDWAEDELHDREEQFQHAQKSEVLGRLTGAIAHDFNNVLAAIIGYGELLRIGLDGPLRKEADEIVKSAARGQALTQQLLSFSRRRVAQPRRLDLNEVVGDIERMLARLLDRRITLVTKLAPGLCPIEADEGQIEQVLLNLAVNARDAMVDTGGTLTITTRDVLIPDEDDDEEESGEFVELLVSDTGHGMDDKTLGHAFEPFFTTKPPDKGTGLGLATVQDIVRQNLGVIWLESDLGRGTTVTIRFPRA